MPEPGDLSRRSRSDNSFSSTQMSGSGRSLRDYPNAHRQSPLEHPRSSAHQPSGTRDPGLQRAGISARTNKRQRGNLWQILFGQGSKRLSRRSKQQPATRKDVKGANVDSPRNFFQRSKPNERLRLTKDQAAAKLADEQVRQAVFGRSRQFGGSSSTLSTVSSRGRLPATREGRGAFKNSGSRAIPAFQLSAQTGERDQASASSQQQVGRSSARRGLSTKRRNGLGIAESSQGTDWNARSSASNQKRDTPARSRSRGFSAGLYAARMLILSVGIGVLVGTVMSMFDPAARLSAGASQQATSKSGAAGSTPIAQSVVVSQGTTTENPSAAQQPQIGQELTALKAALQTLALQHPKLTPGMFLFDLDTNAYMDLNGGASFAAASTIKVPILVAFFQDIDEGKIRLDERLTMQKELVAGGSGELQGLPVGTQLTALETATKMITISDNTATNMIIARLGGIAALNQRFQSWGLVSTTLNNLLPDLSGTNMTSPKELAFLMTRISQGELVSMRSRDRVLDIMQRTVNRSQLPQGLGKGATIAHKTGDIGGLIGDVGLIDMPNGKRYSLTVLVKRSFNDDSAYDLVANTSRAVYQYFNRVPAAQPRPAVNPATAPEQPLPRAENSMPVDSDRALSLPANTAMTQTP
ncbi:MULTISPECIES: serine hydrolase [Cyanophyceae]|uniref:Class A beta-lactamase-related serine hydrolase n=1 Tax=Stenomitos frigidus AS-A4 TaxID=2933935 RepID=A0ABV0KG71_9CYAN|nr:serine hydrolase [Phormidium sp. FACHB-592]